MPLLDVRNLTIELDTPHGRVPALEQVSLTISSGEIHGLVGESGSGKSLLAQAVMGISDNRCHITADRLSWDGQSLLGMSSRERRAIMGRDIAMIFQEPTSCLDPAQPIGKQLSEGMQLAPEELKGLWFWQKRRAQRKHIVNWLHKVGIKDHESIMESYPWELTEGECQKVMIAMALSNQPRLLIADEPTNSMEANTTAQIQRLLVKLNQLHNVSILLISNDLESMANHCDKLTILYCGQTMEAGPMEKLLERPHHPYTHALISNFPQFSTEIGHKEMLPTLAGAVPALQHLPIGCRLGPRCPQAQKTCVKTPRLKVAKGRSYACHFPLNKTKKKKDSKHDGTA
ncbi:peptide ABC transporter ATP-binding protein [Paraferrimonas sedimenticola]|uniref:Peptide ABC transporter ATP-binding protein n=1 Tax=Paraferrimonas sedimenticola TaxID=375674 RepID=A0AA37W0C7_9GAMM|nr:oligopeptide/dipeptide ABC transporter ATP-binding protein [Paraferrimonas sedimenticola]GLP94842.1 peptide ABC transporter ATP-binding protein [Paraferrimonas sedimenticola]